MWSRSKSPLFVSATDENRTPKKQPMYSDCPQLNNNNQARNNHNPLLESETHWGISGAWFGQLLLS